MTFLQEKFNVLLSFFLTIFFTLIWVRTDITNQLLYGLVFLATGAFFTLLDIKKPTQNNAPIRAENVKVEQS